jgi:polygalacturonase
MKPSGFVAFLIVAAIDASSILFAQDTRKVTEPVIPPTCVTLKAALTTTLATSGAIEARAGNSVPGTIVPDTARIQQALDQCTKGHAVELAADSANIAFLSGSHPTAPRRHPAHRQGSHALRLAQTPRTTRYPMAPAAWSTTPLPDVIRSSPPVARPAPPSWATAPSTAREVPKSSLMANPPPNPGGDLAEDARTAGNQQVPRLIDTDLTDDFTLYRITLKNSPNFHVSFYRGEGFTVWAVKIDTPGTARNTDGIYLAQSKNITIAHSYIRTGDDSIDIKAGDGPTTNMSVLDNHFYSGHGMTVGSETNGGVSQVLVHDLSLDGPDNGIRIKSNATRGGLVEDLLYDDICIRNSKYPILFDTTFSFPGKGVQLLPVYDGITLRNVRISGGGKLQFNGYDHTHRIGVTLDGLLLLDGVSHYTAQAIHTDLTFGPGPVNPVFTGDDSNVIGKEVSGTLPSCAAKFVPFPTR